MLFWGVSVVVCEEVCDGVNGSVCSCMGWVGRVYGLPVSLECGSNLLEIGNVTIVYA